MKRLMSIILAVIMVVSVMPYTVFAEEVSSLDYTFTGTNAEDAGYAEGTLTFYAASTAEYYIYWGDDEKALPQYYEITSFVAEKGSTVTYEFPEQTAIPADAECVFVSKSSSCENASVSENIAKFDIPDSKKLYDSSDERQYRYAAFSDIHIDMQNGASAGYYVNASEHWAQALDACVDREVDFIISAGDQVTNAYGVTQEWLTYQQILADSDYVNPVYESGGNHEPRGSYNSDCDDACSDEEYSLGTGLDPEAQAVVEGKTYYEVTEPVTGDHFIFMSEIHAHPGENDNFSEEQLDWLEGLLNEYSGDGKKIFLIQHALIQGYGAGDDTYDPGYQGGIRMAHAETGEEFPNNQRFKEIIEANKEIIWYSGHTHLDFKEEQNYSSENGSSCHMVHIPSACNTTSFTRDSNGYKVLGSSIDYTFYDDSTQGYFVDVFDGATILYGTNLEHNKIYPRYTYLIEEGEPETRPTEEATERPTTAPATQPDIEDGVTVYCVNSANWTDVYAHSWSDGGDTTTWPGYAMTKTDETVNGFDVYMAVLEPDYTGVIFNNNNQGSQTSDLTVQAGQYFDIKSGKWYLTLADIPAVGALATDRYLAGSFNSWSTVANEFMLNAEGDETAYVTLSLDANTTYEFKVVREGTWTSNATPITGDVEGLVFSSKNKDNATITTTVAGDYTFSFGMSTSQLSVVYPTETPTETVEPTENEILYGDVDLDALITILDATEIQCHLAMLCTLSDEQLERGMVSGLDNLTIIDVTLIQEYIAQKIDKFPIEDNTTVAAVSAKDVALTGGESITSEQLFEKAQGYLSAYFQYASYDDYQALKKVVYSYKDTDTTALSADAQAELTEALAVFDALRTKVHQLTVYYTDGKAFGGIRGYYYNSDTGVQVEAWPGQIGSYIRTNSYGQNIYGITLNFSKYDTIIFNSGSNKTEKITLDGCSGKLYYPSAQNTEGAWEVSETTFKQMWYSTEKVDEEEDNVVTDITIYFTDTLDWSKVNCYYWLGSSNNTWPGEAMTYVRDNSQGQPIYKITIPAGASVVFNNGSGVQSVDVTGLANGYGYYLTTKSSGKYLYETYEYGE